MASDIMSTDGNMEHQHVPTSIAFSFTPLKGRIPDSIYTQLSDIPQLINVFRISHFLGQCSHESTRFTRLTENLNYSAQGLLATFPRYFNSTTATEYARQPERIANRIYGSRMGNGPESSGDGWRHRGFGCLQVTGKENQQAFFRYIGLPTDSDPSLIATQYSLVSAAWFFSTNHLWDICDHGIDDTTITTLTKRINGGNLGLSERITETNRFYRLLTT
jgi:putative chitinase